MRTVVLFLVLIVGLVFARTQQAPQSVPESESGYPESESGYPESEPEPESESEWAYPESEPEPESESEWAYPESEPEPESESEWAYPESEPEPESESEWAYPESEAEPESESAPGFPPNWNQVFNPHPQPPFPTNNKNQRCQKDMSHRARKHYFPGTNNNNNWGAKRNVETL